MSATSQNLLDLAFAMDCTGSMGSYIEQARQNIKTIVETIIAKEHADVQLALVEYRDHPPQDFREFVTRVLDFTSSVREMKQRLDNSSAQGGGDCPEAVADALHDLVKLNWREGSTKICVFICDAPPHGLGTSGDGFPDGCPCELDPMVKARELAAKGITVYMVGCEPAITPYRDWFMALAHLTGGQYVPLANANLLSQVIIGGAQEEISLQLLMEEVNADVLQELEAHPEGSVEPSAVEARVYQKMQGRGYKSKHLRRGTQKLSGVSDNAKNLTEASDMKAAKKLYSKMSKPEETQHQMFDGMLETGSARSSYGSRSRGGAAAFGGGFAAAGGSSDAPHEEADYCVTEADVSYSQVSRLVQKSVVSQNLESKYKKFSK